MDQQIIDVGPVHIDDVETARVAVANDATVPPVAETDRLTLLQRNDRLIAGRWILDGIESTVVEDGAVLVDLDERRAAMTGGRRQDRSEMFAVGVDRSGDKSALGAERQ